MGRDLTKWAAQQNFLPKGDYQVLLAMGMVAHDDHGQFFAHPIWFLEEYHSVHGISNHSTLKNHYASLGRRGCIGRIRKGNGRNPRKKGSATLYQLLAYGVLPAEAFAQYEEAVQRRGDPSPHRAQGRMLAKGALEATSTAPRQDFLGSQEVRSRQDFLESQEVRSRQDFLESQEVRSRQDFLEPGSPLQTGLPKVHDGHVYNDHVAATATDAADSQSDFFVEVATACAGIGVHGVRASDFGRLRPTLQTFPRQFDTGDAQWLADEFKLAVRSGRIHNPTGFLVHLVGEYLKSGGTRFYVEDTPDTWGTHSRPDSVINF